MIFLIFVDQQAKALTPLQLKLVLIQCQKWLKQFYIDIPPIRRYKI